MLRAHAGQLLGVEEGARGWRWAVPCRAASLQPAGRARAAVVVGLGIGTWGLTKQAAAGSNGKVLTLHSDNLLCLRCLHAGDKGCTSWWLCPGMGWCPGTAGVSSGHSFTQQVTEVLAGAVQPGATSASCSSQPGQEKPREAVGSVPGLGPLQLPRPLAGAFGAGALGFVPGAACARMLLRPEPAVSRQAGDPRLQEVFAGLGPEQSVQIEVGGELMETGEQLPWSSKAGR